MTALTIPGREDHLRRLLVSVEQTSPPSGTRFVVVYNKPIHQRLADIERQFQSWAPRLSIAVYFNNGDPTISGGRNFQLNLVKTPLVCFVDDDVTVHGPVFETLEHSLREQPFGALGLRSYREGADERFKPRDNTPHVSEGPFRWCTVQGMLVSGYTQLFREIGGFNGRRRFWGEWTELNLRLWRSGFPTGYQMEGPYLRHWEDAPESPTRNMEGRALHVLWGLICTALEYDAVDVNEATESFWQLVEERYLAYSFGNDLSPRTVLQGTLALMPELSAAWGDITAFRERVREHPFQFKPFHDFTRADLDRVRPHARRHLRSLQEEIWQRPRAMGRLIGWLKRRRSERLARV